MVELKRKNRATLNQAKEADLHFIVKVLLWKKCIERGHIAVTEFQIKDKIIDVIDDTNRIIYELEKHPTKKYRDKQLALAQEMNAISMVVDLTKDIPEDVKKAITKLAHLMEAIIP